MTHPGTLLKKHILPAKKELGQNFLCEPGAARRIAGLAGLSRDETVLEIGAGLGALTQALSPLAGRVLAVEKDWRLIPILKEELAAGGINNVDVLNQDILKLDLKDLAGQKRLVVVGNLPYNISSQVLIRLVENRDIIQRAVLMFQKELADRIVATVGTRDYGRLSVVIQYCADIRTLTDLGPNHFFPRPVIDSRVISVTFREETGFPKAREGFLFQVVKAAFSRRRKTLRNSLSGPDLGLSAEAAASALEAAGIDPGRRAETLSVDEFLKLTRVLLKTV